jgi:altronate dehydratase small subunit
LTSQDVKKVILNHSRDNVVTAKSGIAAGTVLTFSKGRKILVREEIPFGHKIALRRIPKEGTVIKYGERIGRAVRAIGPGDLVHTHNVEGDRGKGKQR